MLLMIDNYDSFTYNLVQYFGELGEDVRVYRNDKISLSEIEALKPRRLVISPGPCTPKEAGVSVEAIQYFGGRLPLLGVCLGHQSLAVAFGGEVIRAERLMHGKTSMVRHDGRTIFRNLSNPFEATQAFRQALSEVERGRTPYVLLQVMLELILESLVAARTLVDFLQLE